MKKKNKVGEEVVQEEEEEEEEGLPVQMIFPENSSFEEPVVAKLEILPAAEIKCRDEWQHVRHDSFINSCTTEVSGPLTRHLTDSFINGFTYTTTDLSDERAQPSAGRLSGTNKFSVAFACCISKTDNSLQLSLCNRSFIKLCGLEFFKGKNNI